MPADDDALGAAIRRGLPDRVAFAGGSIEAAAAGPLFAAEAAAVQAAVEKRRAEFTAGRTYARRALAQLGVAAGAIPVGQRRAPVWPAGTIGSIAHCPGYCTAVAARAGELAGIGIDVERDEPIAAELIARICGAAELDQRAALEARLGFDLPKLLFAVKESVYKAYFPLARTFLEFADVAVEVDAPGGTFSARLTNGSVPAAAGTRRFDGRFVRAAGIVAAWTTIPLS